MCKYCGETCLGNICPKCSMERATILMQNHECHTFNEFFAISGFLSFLSFVACIILIAIIIFNDVTNVHYMAAIVTALLHRLFKQLRKLFDKQVNIVVDREMKNRH